MGKFEKNTPFWKRLTEALLEILVELVAAVIFFIIGAGILILLSSRETVQTMDPDLIFLVGAIVVLAFFGILFAVIAAIRKYRKK